MTTQQKYFIRGDCMVSETYLGLDFGQEDHLYDLIIAMHPQELKELLDYVSSMVKQDEVQHPISFGKVRCPITDKEYWPPINDAGETLERFF